MAFIRKGKLYTGHVGDSRIVIGLKEQGNRSVASIYYMTINIKIMFFSFLPIYFLNVLIHDLMWVSVVQ